MEGESVKRRHDLIPVSKSVLLGIDLSLDLFSNWIKLVLLRVERTLLSGTNGSD